MASLKLPTKRIYTLLFCWSAEGAKLAALLANFVR